LFKELRKNFSALSLYEAKAKLEEIENMEAQTNAIFAHSLEKLKNMSKNYTETSTLLSFLWYLQEMLETESQIYRRSFYFGALPILRVISSFLYERKEISRKEDILFLFPPEILGYLRNDLRKLIEKRKETYWKVITEEKKGVSPQRLEVLIDGDYQR
jgi:predicted RNA-binding protein